MNQWAVYATKDSTGPFDDFLVAGPFATEPEARHFLNAHLAALWAKGWTFFGQDAAITPDRELHQFRVDLYREVAA